MLERKVRVALQICFQSGVRLSCSEDGVISRYDARISGRAESTLQLGAEATSALYHPRMPHLFATSDSKGSVHLRDERMAFSGTRNPGIVLTFNTKLTKRDLLHISNPEASSLAFDREGSYSCPPFRRCIK